MMALSLLQLLHIGEHLPQVLLYLKVFSTSMFFAIQELWFWAFFSMCFPPQIGSLLKESIIDLKVQKSNLDMVLVYLRWHVFWLYVPLIIENTSIYYMVRGCFQKSMSIEFHSGMCCFLRDDDADIRPVIRVGDDVLSHRMQEATCATIEWSSIG